MLSRLTSTCFEGRHCPLAHHGHSCDERRSNLRIVAGQRRRFEPERLVPVGDRGLLAAKRIEEDLRPHQGLDWITAVRTPETQRRADRGVRPPPPGAWAL